MGQAVPEEIGFKDTHTHTIYYFIVFVEWPIGIKGQDTETIKNKDQFGFPL